MSGIGDFVRGPGYRPSLRSELRFYREGDKDIVTIHDPVRDRRYQLYEHECLIAHEMNGGRDLEQLTRAAQLHVPWATRKQVEGLTIQIAGMGLLANIPEQLFARSSEQLIPPPPPPPESPPPPADDDAGLDEMTQLSDGAIDLPPDGSESIFEPPAAHEIVSPTPETAAPAAPSWEVERPAFHRRHRKLVYVGGFLFVILALSLIPYPLYITEPCHVRPVSRSQVRAEIEGIIAEVLVKEGDTVEIGTPVARLEDRDITYAMEQATANVEALSASLAKVRAGNRPEEIRGSKANAATRAQDVRFAAIEAARQQRLFKQGVASAAQRDEAARQLAVKQSMLEQARAELKLTESGSRSEEITIAEAELKRAQAEVEFLKKKQALLTIRSPIAGRVLTPRFEEHLHARVAPGDEVCEIGSFGDMLVEVSVDESEADAIHVGQTVKVKVRSFPLETFAGTIDRIAPAVIDENGRRILRVDAKVDNRSGLLQPRMTGYAEIDAGMQTIMRRIVRRALRWTRVRFLI